MEVQQLRAALEKASRPAASDPMNTDDESCAHFDAAVYSGPPTVSHTVSQGSQGSSPRKATKNSRRVSLGLQPNPEWDGSEKQAGCGGGGPRQESRQLASDPEPSGEAIAACEDRRADAAGVGPTEAQGVHRPLVWGAHQPLVGASAVCGIDAAASAAACGGSGVGGEERAEHSARSAANTLLGAVRSPGLESLESQAVASRSVAGLLVQKRNSSLFNIALSHAASQSHSNHIVIT